MWRCHFDLSWCLIVVLCYESWWSLTYARPVSSLNSKPDEGEAPTTRSEEQQYLSLSDLTSSLQDHLNPEPGSILESVEKSREPVIQDDRNRKLETPPRSASPPTSFLKALSSPSLLNQMGQFLPASDAWRLKVVNKDIHSVMTVNVRMLYGLKHSKVERVSQMRLYQFCLEYWHSSPIAKHFPSLKHCLADVDHLQPQNATQSRLAVLFHFMDQSMLAPPANALPVVILDSVQFTPAQKAQLLYYAAEILSLFPKSEFFDLIWETLCGKYERTLWKQSSSDPAECRMSLIYLYHYTGSESADFPRDYMAQQLSHKPRWKVSLIELESAMNVLCSNPYESNSATLQDHALHCELILVNAEKGFPVQSSCVRFYVGAALGHMRRFGSGWMVDNDPTRARKDLPLNARSFLRQLMGHGYWPNLCDLKRFMIPLSYLVDDTDLLEDLLAAGSPIDGCSAMPPPLHQASQYNAQENMKILLQFGANPNQAVPNGQTALMWANSVPVSTLLLDYGADLDTKDAVGMTALCHAMYKREVSLVHALLDAGANPYVRLNGNRTLIMMYPLMALFLLQRVPDLIDCMDEHNSTALFYFVQPDFTVMSLRERRELVRTAIKLRLNVNHQNLVRHTALHLAQDPDIISILVREGGASLTVIDIYGLTPLMYAASSGNAVQVSALLDVDAQADFAGPSGSTAIFFAYDILTTQVLTDRGKSRLNVERKDGCTPLFAAVKDSWWSKVDYLLAKGVPINAKNRFGQSALFYAQSIEMVQYLVALHGASVDLEDHSGFTPLFAAVLQNNVPVAIMLISFGANPNYVSHLFGETPLFYAMDLPMIRLLVNAGGHLETQNAAGRTPLSDAVLKGEVEKTHSLLLFGAES